MSDEREGDTTADRSRPGPVPAEDGVPKSDVLTGKRPLGLLDLMASGSWYAIPAIWAFSAFLRMAIQQSDKLVIGLLAGSAVALVWLVAYAAIYKARTGRLPNDKQQGAALRTGCWSIYSVIWAGFATGCIASMIVIIELNDPFSKERVDQVVQGHAPLLWGAVAAGVILGAGGCIWSLARPAQPTASHQVEDARAAR